MGGGKRKEDLKKRKNQGLAKKRQKKKLKRHLRRMGTEGLGIKVSLEKPAIRKDFLRNLLSV